MLQAWSAIVAAASFQQKTRRLLAFQLHLHHVYGTLRHVIAHEVGGGSHLRALVPRRHRLVAPTRMLQQCIVPGRAAGLQRTIFWPSMRLQAACLASAPFDAVSLDATNRLRCHVHEPLILR